MGSFSNASIDSTTVGFQGYEAPVGEEHHHHTSERTSPANLTTTPTTGTTTAAPSIANNEDDNDASPIMRKQNPRPPDDDQEKSDDPKEEEDNISASFFGEAVDPIYHAEMAELCKTRWADWGLEEGKSQEELITTRQAHQGEAETSKRTAEKVNSNEEQGNSKEEEHCLSSDGSSSVTSASITPRKATLMKSQQHHPPHLKNTTSNPSTSSIAGTPTTNSSSPSSFHTTPRSNNTSSMLLEGGSIMALSSAIMKTKVRREEKEVQNEQEKKNILYIPPQEQLSRQEEEESFCPSATPKTKNTTKNCHHENNKQHHRSYLDVVITPRRSDNDTMTEEEEEKKICANGDDIIDKKEETPTTATSPSINTNDSTTKISIHDDLKKNSLLSSPIQKFNHASSSAEPPVPIDTDSDELKKEEKEEEKSEHVDMVTTPCKQIIPSNTNSASLVSPPSAVLAVLPAGKSAPEEAETHRQAQNRSNVVNASTNTRKFSPPLPLGVVPHAPLLPAPWNGTNTLPPPPNYLQALAPIDKDTVTLMEAPSSSAAATTVAPRAAVQSTMMMAYSPANSIPPMCYNNINNGMQKNHAYMLGTGQGCRVLHVPLCHTSLTYLPYPTSSDTMMVQENLSLQLPSTFALLDDHHPAQIFYNHTCQRMFFGHFWSKLAHAGILEWFGRNFTKCKDGIRPYFCHPQYHYNRLGWFKGCMHIYLYCDNPAYVQTQLHRRILFDVGGVWYASNTEEMKTLENYCASLMNMDESERKEKLGGLPATPLTCEMAENQEWEA